ncbi:chromosome partitioning protein [Micromonospora sp. NPDC047134]|uniref:MinD/ParA family ATP-binding protein n=1 Tax=Micromonospora sp. NPDC047134 TaxID=3154340 RepID=UPI0033C0B504
MVDENADRVPAPGQHGVPERDIEPLWPPDQIDGFGASGWDPPPPAATPPGVRPTTPPGVHPATPPGVHPVPSATQPGVPGGYPNAVPPSPADYPSLTGGPVASGWAPATANQPDPGVPAGPDFAASGSAWGSDTDSAGTTAGSGSAWGPGAEGSAWGPGADSAGTAAASGRAVVPVGPQPEAGQVDLNLPFTLDPPTALTPNREGAASTANDNADPAHPDSAPETAPDGGEPTPARPTAESPWAQPPQRSGAATPPETGERGVASAVTPRPTWAGPAQPLPPIPTAPFSGAAIPPQPGPAVPPQPGPHQPLTPAHPHGDPSAHQGGDSSAQQGGYAVAPQHGEQGRHAASAQHGDPEAVESPVPQPGPPLTATAQVPPFTAAAQVPAPSADGRTPVAPPPGPGAPQVGPAYATPPGPFPPQPAWQPAPWQQQGPPAATAPSQPVETASRTPPGYADQGWTQETGGAPTAEDFARRRQVRPTEPVATIGLRAVVNKTGLVKLPPGRHELELKRDIEMVRRNFGGLRQVTVVNPKGGAGKTVAILLLAMTFGQKRGGYVLAWDNNETQGTLGMRAQQDFHSRTVRDLLRDLGQFHGAHGRVGDLSQYVRSQGEGMFDVLASDESATGGEMLTAAAFGEIREVVSRFYKLIFVDTGNNVRAQNWQAAMDATDQLVVTMSARNDSAETAARMLDHLEQSGRQRLVRQAVTVVSMPPSRKEIDLPAIQEHFAARTRAVLLAPYERLIDTGEPIRYAGLSAATRDAWLKIAAAVAEGL